MSADTNNNCHLEMSNAIGCCGCPVAESHQDHHGSQSEHLWTSVTFQSGVSVFSNQRAHVVWLTVASQCFKIARLRTFRLHTYSICASQRDGNPAFTAHAVRCIAHAFRAAMKRKICCHQGCTEGFRTRRRPRASGRGHQRVQLQKVHFYLITRSGVHNFLWMLVALRRV